MKTKCSNLTVCKDLLILRSHSAWVHGSKIQNRAREKLDADGAFKVMDAIVYEGAEGRRKKKTKDPSYTGPIKYIDRSKGDPDTPGFKGGYVKDTEGKSETYFCKDDSKAQRKKGTATLTLEVKRNVEMNRSV